MRTVICALSSALLLAGGLIAWQDAAPSSHEAAARELVQTMQIEHMISSAFESSIAAQAKTNPAIAPYKDVMLEWGRKYMTWDALEPQMVKLYADTFSETELREMAAFYKTPTGAKAVVKLPEMFQKGAEIGAALAQQHQAELMQMIAAHDKAAKDK